MAKITRQVGTTSLIVELFVLDATSTVGAGKTGLLFNSSGIKAYYKRNAASASTAITLVTISTLGTFASGGFKEVDATNLPGVYEFHVPDAALATGADSVVVLIQGASAMVPVPLEIELTATSNQDSVRGGMTALPNGPTRVKKNQALGAFPFPMFNSSGAVVTGLTVTAQVSKDGAAFGTSSNSVVEVGNGWYKLDLTATEMNADTIALRFSAAGTLDTDFTLVTQP